MLRRVPDWYRRSRLTFAASVVQATDRVLGVDRVQPATLARIAAVLGLDVQWGGNSNPASVDREVAERMQKAKKQVRWQAAVELADWAFQVPPSVWPTRRARESTRPVRVPRPKNTPRHHVTDAELAAEIAEMEANVSHRA